jgi:hypothetical protein
MTTREGRDYWDNRGLLLLWTAMLAGPLAWTLNLGINYSLVKWACSRSHPLLLATTNVLMFAVVVWSVFLARSCVASLRDRSDEEGGSPADRSYFMALTAIGVNVLIALLIVLTAFPHFVLTPCE